MMGIVIPLLMLFCCITLSICYFEIAQHAKIKDHIALSLLFYFMSAASNILGIFMLRAML